MMNFQEAYPDTCSTVSRAARLGNTGILKKLIKAGKPVDVKDNRGWQPIHEAAFFGHVDCLRIIVRKGAEVDSRTFEEQTPLMFACKAGNPECVDCLLKAGADPNSTTNEDYTPLWEASLKRSIECVELLVEAGARVNTQNFTLDTPLHGVVHQNEDDTDIVKCLVEAGADLTIQNECGLTPFFIAAQFGLAKCLEYFIEYADSKGDEFKTELVNKAAEDDATPLFLATQNEHVGCVRLLLDNGADPYKGILDPEKKGICHLPILPLHMALYKDNKECLRMLLNGTKLETFSWKEHNYCTGLEYNYNPIIIAGTLDSEDCLKILLEKAFFHNLFGDANFRYLAANNILSFGFKVRPAVLIVKQFYPFLKRCIKANKSTLIACIPTSFDDDQNNFHGFLLTLRLEASVIFHRYWLDHADMASSALPYFCALLKYTIKDYRGLNYYSTSGVSDFPRGSWSVFTCPVQRPEIRKLQLYITSLAQTDTRERLLKEQMGDQYKEIVDKDDLFNLQNLCRRTILLQILRYRTDIITSVRSLQLPDIIKNFLSFEDDSEFSNQVITALERLEKEENKLDKVFEDVRVN